MSIKKPHLYIIVGIIITAFLIAFYLFNEPISGSYKETKESSYSTALKKIDKMDSLYSAGELVIMRMELDSLIANRDLWQKNVTSYQYAFVFSHISDFHYKLGNLDEAKNYNKIALSKYDDIEEIYFKSNLLNNQANIEADLGNYTKAIAILFKYAELYKDDLKSTRLIDCYNNLGVMYRDTKNYDLAIEYFKKFGEIITLNNVKNELGYYYANLGATYMEIGDIDKAIKFLEDSKSHFVINSQDNDVIAVNTLLASCYLKLNRGNMAKAILTNNIEQSEKLHLWESYVETCNSLFDIYIAQNETEKALEFINKGLSRSHHSNQQRLEIKIYEKLKNFYAESGNYKEAFNYQQKQGVIKDSLQSTTKNNTIRELTVKYETDLKNSQIEKLENLNKEEKRLKRIYLGILGVTIIVILLISFLMNRIFVQKKAIEQSNQTKDKLFSIIAHDLRSPMIALQGTEVLVKRYIDRGEYDKLIALANKTDNALFRINHLLDNLLNWSVTNSKQLAYSPQCTAITDLANEAISVHFMSIESKNIMLETDMSSGNVFIDPQMVSCVLRNIISNAVKYSPENGNIRITGETSGRFYCITVADNGSGIPEAVIEKISANKEDIIAGGNKNSFGLGLRLAFLFIRKNKGHINIENTTAGTLVKIYLPLNTP